MGDMASINKKIDDAAAELLAKHRAIIEHWFDRWQRREQKRIDAVFDPSRSRAGNETGE